MHLHFLGICGTFMGSLALVARQLGHRVTGSDSNVYPPMSTQLEQQGIELWQGYEPKHLQPAPDLVVVGNAMSRGNAAVEYMLDEGLDYISGPQWLCQHLLAQRWVLAVAGTHGKTTTASMLAWILEDNGLGPGYLIGGVPGNFATSANIGTGKYFVIEADEYDTAFFDKRSKFVHYRPRTLVINNIEYDHADIFPDLAAIQRQFHHLVRMVPKAGNIVAAAGDIAVAEVLAMGCWTPTTTFSTSLGDYSARKLKADGSQFVVLQEQREVAELCWEMLGDHNIANALAAIAAAEKVGVSPVQAAASLSRFRGVKRRLEKIGEVDGICVYDDFAHHPTAIESTIAGLRSNVGAGRIFALLEPRSNTMKLGVHQATLGQSVREADFAWWYQPTTAGWRLADSIDPTVGEQRVFDNVEKMIDALLQEVRSSDHVLVMSNGAFDDIHRRLIRALEDRLGAAK
jgi:UDP-N-acetylmuramate: L-alanyl-gamma-D-glutamyl-meso-diaminopimelate ligase